MTLPKAFRSLKPGGVLAVISFHSLEDRIVKRFMRKMSGRPQHRGDQSFIGERTAYAEMLQTKAIFPTREEVLANPKSRSARLRVLGSFDIQKCKMSKTAISLVVLLTIFGGACAIGIVWLRMDISDVAARCGVLEDEEVLSREVQELRGQRSWALRPSTLASMVEEDYQCLGLGRLIMFRNRI